MQSKMMASLDFNQSRHTYMKFQPIANQVPKRPEKKTYQVSAKSADWSSLSVAETEFQGVGHDNLLVCLLLNAS